MFGMNLSYSRTRGENRFRGRNINAPIERRPSGSDVGNVTQVESTANMRGQNFIAGINFQIPARRLMLFANYAWLNQENDADGAFSVPANSYDLSSEWGPVAGVPRHNVSAMFSTPLVKSAALALERRLPLRHALQHHHRAGRQRRHRVQRSSRRRGPQRRPHRSRAGTSAAD